MPYKSSNRIIDHILGPFNAKQIIIKGYYMSAMKIVEELPKATSNTEDEKESS